MEIEREAALQAAGDIRPRALPRPPLRKHANLRQVVRVGELFEQQIREGSRRLADDKPRMPATLDENHALAAPPQRKRHQRSGKSGTDDRNIGVNSHWPP